MDRLCNTCAFIRNCLNGLYCVARKGYVEYTIITSCGKYKPKQQRKSHEKA